MIKLAVVAGFVLLGVPGSVPALSAQAPQAESTVLAAQTRIEVAVTAPVWARTAKSGDPLYTQVDFPVIAGKSVAIPAGTYAQGTILSIKRPSRFKSRAEIEALFTHLIFANGYAVELPPLPTAGADFSQNSPAATGVSRAPVLMKLTIDVSASNDLLLDNGAQFNITLASPLPLDTNQLAGAYRVSRPLDLAQLKSSTLCRPTPGTPGSPGTPDTVIPGSPGTPSTSIPGGPGQPDIVIPGTPATPPTVIPGSPGTPGFAGRSCPRAPLVISSESLAAWQPQSTASIPPAHP